MSREPTKPLVIEKPQRTLSLNAEEVRHLADAVHNDDYTRGRHSEADAYSEIARKALLLLGGAYVELVHEDGMAEYDVNFQIDEEVCWLLRSKVSTSTMSLDGFTNIGIGLLRKLYSLLASFQVELDVGILVIDDATPALDDVRKRMEEFNAQYSPSADPSTDPGADADAIPVHAAGSGSGLPDRPGQAVPGSAETHHEGDVTVPPVTHEHQWTNMQDPDPANYLGTGYITACIICRERRTDWGDNRFDGGRYQSS